MANIVSKYLSDIKDIRKKFHNNIEMLEHLCWYDKKLSYFISPLGSISVIRNYLIDYLFKKKINQNMAQNYHIDTVYFKDVLVEDIHNRFPSVWRYQAIKSQPWFNDLPALKYLEENADIFCTEYQQIKQYMAMHPDNNSLTSSGKWNGLFMHDSQGKVRDEFIQHCPQTIELLGKLPLCYPYGFSMFSEVLPKSHIMPHCGSSNLRLRLHLGIYIPEIKKAKIRVGEEWRYWEQGKALAFDDSYSHEVKHEGELNRVIMSVDIWHPNLSQEEINILNDPKLSSFGRTISSQKKWDEILKK